MRPERASSASAATPFRALAGGAAGSRSRATRRDAVRLEAVVAEVADEEPAADAMADAGRSRGSEPISAIRHRQA